MRSKPCDDTPPDVPAPYRWKEVPALGGNRKWDLRRSEDSSDVLHACTSVHWTCEKGIYVARYGKEGGRGYPDIDAAMEAVKARMVAEDAERRARYEAAKAAETKKHEEWLAAQVADPRCLQSLVEEVQWLKDRVQALEDKSHDHNDY